MKKGKIVLCCILAVVVALGVWTAWGNTALEVNIVTVESSRLPGEFSGFRIAQVSDLHNTEFGEGNSELLELLRETNPDMIALTGDLVDSRKTDVSAALAFAAEAVKIAPCYYVPGNHESRIRSFGELEEGLRDCGVTVLRDESLALERDGEILLLLGADDPAFYGEGAYYEEDGPARNLAWIIGDRMGDWEGFTLLLCHRPEMFDVYTECGVDLALSGHVHGGQFRLPFVGGLVGPHQGLFPKYDSGLYTEGDTNMVVSRGLGNSLFPFRFNNRPEVVLVEMIRS